MSNRILPRERPDPNNKREGQSICETCAEFKILSGLFSGNRKSVEAKNSPTTEDEKLLPRIPAILESASINKLITLGEIQKKIVSKKIKITCF